MSKKLEIVSGKNIQQWLIEIIAPELLSPNRDYYLRQKENNEKLSAALIAITTCFRTTKVQSLAFLDSVHSNTDCIIIDSQDGTSDEIQVVSTWDSLDIKDDVNANIYKRIKSKNNKYIKNSVRHIHLCVFVGQMHYKEINLNNLHEFVKKDPVFANYWLIVPVNNNCQFYVCDISAGIDKEVYECIIDFTPPNSISINNLIDYLDTGKLLEIDKCFKNK